MEAAQALVESSSGLQRTRQLAAFHSGEAAAAVEAMSPAGWRVLRGPCLLGWPPRPQARQVEGQELGHRQLSALSKVCLESCCWLASPETWLSCAAVLPSDLAMTC